MGGFGEIRSGMVVGQIESGTTDDEVCLCGTNKNSITHVIVLVEFNSNSTSSFIFIGSVPLTQGKTAYSVANP